MRGKRAMTMAVAGVMLAWGSLVSLGLSARLPGSGVEASAVGDYSALY